MNLDSLLPLVAAAGLFDLFLLMVWMVIVISRSLQRQSPLNVRLKVMPRDGQQQETAKASAAAPVPPEAVPGPDFQWPEPETDGKVGVACSKCGTMYRVYPNRLWYTCSKCQEKVWVVKAPEAKVEPKAKSPVEKKKAKFQSPADLI